MADTDATVWGIHAGKTGDAHNIFLNENVVALGWTKVGDLSGLPPNPDACRAAAPEGYPEKAGMAVPVSAGQTFRFFFEVKVGYLITHASKHRPHVPLGRLTGGSRYVPSKEKNSPQPRLVQWPRSEPR